MLDLLNLVLFLNNMKKQIAIILVILLGIIGLFKLNNHYAIWNNNSINVTTEGTLNSKKVKIKYGNSVKNRSLEGRKPSSKYSTTLYDSGKQKEKLINEYGENDFYIEYDSSYYFEFRHFKLNCNDQHNYNFHFFQKDTSIIVRLDIKGRYKTHFEALLLKL